MNLALELLRRHCGSCGANHYASVCPTCKTPTPEFCRLFGKPTGILAAPRPDAWTPSWPQIGRRLVRFLESGAAALGLAVVLLAVGFWWARDDLGAWYRTLPVVIAATHCPGAK